MQKKVLILCTGNSCRSIIAEALINSYIDGIKAYSAGVKASGKVNKNAKKVLELDGSWSDDYYSKMVEEIIDIKFDLVVTVCDNAKESCPVFPLRVEVIHIGFEDPDGKEFYEFEKTIKLIKDELLPVVSEKLS